MRKDSPSQHKGFRSWLQLGSRYDGRALSTRSSWMTRYLTGCVFLFAAASQATEPKGGIVRETWDAAYLDNAKAGYVHTSTRAVDSDGQQILRTTMVLDLT